MPNYQKARAVRIWQDEQTNVEYTASCSFLWELVTKLEHENGSSIHWQDTQPKTYVCLADGSGFYVLGGFHRWDAKHDRYLAKAETRMLLFCN